MFYFLYVNKFCAVLLGLYLLLVFFIVSIWFSLSTCLFVFMFLFLVLLMVIFMVLFMFMFMVMFVVMFMDMDLVIAIKSKYRENSWANQRLQTAAKDNETSLARSDVMDFY